MARMLGKVYRHDKSDCVYGCCTSPSDWKQRGTRRRGRRSQRAKERQEFAREVARD